MLTQKILPPANLPDPNQIFPNEYKTSCFVKNVVKTPNVQIGDYTYYDDSTFPTDFEKNNILFNYPEFGEKLIIGKFCQIASGTKFTALLLKLKWWDFRAKNLQKSCRFCARRIYRKSQTKSRRFLRNRINLNSLTCFYIIFTLHLLVTWLNGEFLENR